MTQSKTAKPRARRYFVIDEGELYIVKDGFFADVESRLDALYLALGTWFELRKQLTEDAETEVNTLIGNMKITTGLERTLAKLDETYPGLLVEMRSIERRADGIRVYTC